jgi:hypothetical protein
MNSAEAKACEQDPRLGCTLTVFGETPYLQTCYGLHPRHRRGLKLSKVFASVHGLISRGYRRYRLFSAGV